MDFYAVTDIEADDEILKKLLQAAAGSISIPGVTFANHFTVYSTPGNSTFTVPAGVTVIQVHCVGGGGGGGGGYANLSGGSGGGGGGYTRKTIAVTPGQQLVAHVGAGGGVSSPDGSGYNGGASTFGGVCSAGGGLGGERGYAGSGGMCIGLGGNATGGDFNLVGSYGGNGGAGPHPYLCWGGIGGQAGGIAGGGGAMTSGAGVEGTFPGGGGSGGGGGSAIHTIGAGGANGMVLIEWSEP